jgi:outer membrane biogenesis lipoprotein LolB
MRVSLVKGLLVLLLASALLLVAACTTAESLGKAKPVSTEPWWQGKPRSQMTPAELEEQDPEFWNMWRNLHGVGTP